MRRRRGGFISSVAALTQKHRSFTISGFEIPLGTHRVDLGRPFMARFGDIARLEERGRDLRVTLKSGTVVELAWGAANDFDDGVRVWDDKRGVVDLASWAGGIPPPAQLRIRTIELLPTATLRAVPARLHGTVRTRHGDFSGFIQWNRQSGISTDELDGRTTDGPAGLLVFVDCRDLPDYLPWPDIVQIDFDWPPAMYHPSKR